MKPLKIKEIKKIKGGRNAGHRHDIEAMTAGTAGSN